MSRDVAWGVALFVLCFSLLLVISLLGQELVLPFDASLVIIFGEVVLLLPVWYFAFYKYGTRWTDLGLRAFHPHAVGMGCGLMALYFLLHISYAVLLGLFGLQIQPDITTMFDNTTFPLALLFGGAVVAPFVEEVFFRGFVFAGLRHQWGWQKAAFVSAGIFAVAHIIPTSIPPIFILGLIFAYLYHLSGSIWPAILMHMLVNTTSLSIVYAISQGWISLP
jgi:membrane protease YdiL (CAAX protease family)